VSTDIMFWDELAIYTVLSTKIIELLQNWNYWTS